MSLIRLNRHPAPRELLVFAAAWAVFTGVIGWVQWRAGRTGLAEACWILSAIVPLIGLVWREGLRLLFVGLCYATFPIGLVVSTLILAVIYYGVLTPIGLILRVCRHDPLQKSSRARAESYWQPRPPRRPAADYFRQH